MTIRDQIVAEARTWIDTPFKHQARVKGLGVDCAGIVIETGRALGLLDYPEQGYSRQPSPDKMGALLDEYLDRIDKNEVMPGDIYWMRFIEPMHLAISTVLNDGRTGIVHAYSRVGKCTEHGLDAKWRGRIVRAYRYRGVDG